MIIGVKVMEEKKDIYILGIESSCDDTSAAVLRNGVLLSNVTASQEVHRAYGGVVPELASRAHQQNVVPVVDQAIKRAGITKEDLSAVAFTRGPGLMGSLLVGVSFAKGFARSLNIPLMFSPECVLRGVTSRDVRLLHLSNMQENSFTLEVSRGERSTDSRLSQPESRPFIAMTPDVP